MVKREGIAQSVARVSSTHEDTRFPSKQAAQSLHRVMVMMMVVMVMVMVEMVRGFFWQGFGKRGRLSHLHRRDSCRHAR